MVPYAHPRRVTPVDTVSKQARNREPVTSQTLLFGCRSATQPCPRRLRIGALAIGCVATGMMGVVNLVVGCTTVIDGTPTVDTAVAPAYRTSVSAPASESSATSRVKESQRQQHLTTQAVVNACESFAKSSKDAIAKVNDFVGAFNQGRDAGPTEGPAIAALNNSADTVASSISDPLSQELRNALNAYVDAAHEVAQAIRVHAPTPDFNRRVDQLNDTKSKAVKVCLAFK